MTLTRGKLAKEVGCNSETIRYYETVGMIPEPARASNGYRIYTEEHLMKLRFIQRAKELGFSTESVRNLLRITDDSADHTRAEVKALTNAHIEDIVRKVNDLTDLKKSLVKLSNQCDGAQESAENCPIINSLYRR